MSRHAAKKHEAKWKEVNVKVESKDQPKVSTYFVAKPNQAEKYSVESPKRKVLNRKLALFLAKDMRPISVVKNQGFRAFVEELDPRYTLPSTTTLQKKLLPTIYSEVMTTLKANLNNVKYITMTTDGWTSIASDKYNAFTVHYIDWSQEEPELKSGLLECAPYAKKSSMIELEKEVRRITEKYEITSKVVLTIADNASDIQGALKIFGAPSIGCVAHTINLSAKHAMEKCDAIETLKTKLAKIVRTTKISAGAKNCLTECCKKVGIQGKSNK